jgi:hypothetical protein
MLPKACRYTLADTRRMLCKGLSEYTLKRTFGIYSEKNIWSILRKEHLVYTPKRTFSVYS